MGADHEAESEIMLKKSAKAIVGKTANSKGDKNYSDAAAKWRSTMAQWLATIANSTLFLGVGMMAAVPTVVIGELHKSNQPLSLDDEQASWFGSLMLLIQPVGCVIACFLQHYIGRKSGMLLMNVPELISWAIMYAATSVRALYVAATVMGISAGFMEAPGLAYIGEISEPRLRGVLTSYANINVSVGMLVQYLMGSIFDWRTTVAVSALFPIVGIVLIACVPDSPVWLLSKGRKEDALKALRWLRGWVPEDKVKAEFEELCQYTEMSNRPRMAEKIHVEYPTNVYVSDGRASGGRNTIESYTAKIKDTFRPAMLRPFRLIIVYQIIFHCAALTGIRCYMVEIFRTLRMPIEPQWLVFVTSLVMIAGGLICITTVKFVGKRILSLISLAICSLGSIVVGVYAFYENEINQPWIPMVTICILYFATNIGIGPIPWMLISEVFPVRGRSFGAGLSAAAFYITAFFFSKSYLDMEKWIGLPGCFCAYGVGGLVGFVFLYFCLPETEGKTLAEVESFFSGHPKRRPVNVDCT